MPLHRPRLSVNPPINFLVTPLPGLPNTQILILSAVVKWSNAIHEKIMVGPDKPAIPGQLVATYMWCRQSHMDPAYMWLFSECK